MDESKIDSHLKTTALEKFKDFISENYTKYIKFGKNKTDCISNGVSLCRFFKLLNNYIPNVKVFFELLKKTNFLSIHML